MEADRPHTASRRQVLIAGGGGLALLGAGTLARPAAAAPVAALARPGAFLLDTLLDDAEAIARCAERARVRLIEFSGDIGTVGLERLWTQADGPIVGATFGGALFCAEQLARGSGLAPVFAWSLPQHQTSLVAAAELALGGATQGFGAAPAARPIASDRPVLWALAPRAGATRT